MLARILRELERASGRPEVAAALPAIKEGMAGKSAAWESLKNRHAKSLETLSAAQSAAAALARRRRPRCGSSDPRRADRHAALSGGGAALFARHPRHGRSSTARFARASPRWGRRPATPTPSLADQGARTQAALAGLRRRPRRRARGRPRSSASSPWAARVDLLSQTISRSVQASLEDKERWRVYLFFYAAALLIGVG